MRKAIQETIKKNENLIKNILKCIYVPSTIIMQTSILFSIALLLKKPWEFGMLAFGFFPSRIAFHRTYHAKTLIGCTVISSIVFGTACAIVPTTHASLILQGIFGAAIAFSMWLIEEFKERLKGERK